MIQLKNGSRISEAIEAFHIFIKDGFKNKTLVKIAKSGGVKYKFNKTENKKTKEKFISKTRYRKMMFPDSWIDLTQLNNLLLKLITTHNKEIDSVDRYKVFQYMENHFNSNTHSLRYAFINYMIYEQKRPLNDVAKFVGHVNVGQLVTYTQQKNCDKIFEIDY